MQINGNFGGRVGPFRDAATGQVVGGMAQGSYALETAAPGDGSQLLPQVNASLLQALGAVIGNGLASGRLSAATVESAVPQLLGEVAQAAQVERFGAQIVGMQVFVRLDPAAAAAPQAGFAQPGMQPPQAGFGQPGMQPPQAGFGQPGMQPPQAAAGWGAAGGGMMAGLVEETKSRMTWWIIGAVVSLVAVGAAAFLYWKITRDVGKAVDDSRRKAAEMQAETRARVAAATGGSAAARDEAAAAWDGSEPLTCGGNQDLRIEGVQASFDEGFAIKAAGNCKLELVDVEISAPIAIEAAANAKVTVRGGSVTGTELAAKAGAAATITFEGTEVTGETKTAGAAEIVGP